MSPPRKVGGEGEARNVAVNEMQYVPSRQLSVNFLRARELAKSRTWYSIGSLSI